MIHYSCDLCGRSIDDKHFVVKIEVAASFDPEAITEEDLDADHLEQIADIIAQSGTNIDLDLDESSPKQFTYDLCQNCMQQYIKAPLGPIRPSARLNFSQN